MGAIYDNDFYQGNEPTLSEPLRFPKIGYDNVVSGADLVASTSVAGFPVESLANSFTFELWKPSELPATVDVDAGRVVNVDYLAFGAHALGGCSIALEYSADGTNYYEAVSGGVVRDRAGMMLFEPVVGRYFRLTITAGVPLGFDFNFVTQQYLLQPDAPTAADVYLGVLYIGKALEMQRGVYQGHTPGEFARTDEIRPSVSEGGQWLGRSVVRRGFETGFSFQNLKADWVRSTLAPFLDAAITQPFFIAWRPETKADEVLFGWSNSPIVPTNSGPRDYMSVDFNVSAHGGV